MISDITFTVSGTDDNGCEGTSSVDIEVIDNITETAINLFTPNNDGKNDYWRLDNPRIYEHCDISIFNTWGEKIFSQNNFEDKWFGTYQKNGVDVPDGVYYYKVRCTNITGTKVQFTGDITLLR